MIQLTDRLWIGGHNSENRARAAGIGAVLNVAQDLHCRLGWPEVEAMHVGLIDGPGNPPAAYSAAIFALVSLLHRHEKVLVCCHGGSRSLAVVLMHLILRDHVLHGITRAECGLVEHGWEWWLEVLRERVDIELPAPNESHRVALGEMNWKVFEDLT